MPGILAKGEIAQPFGPIRSGRPPLYLQQKTLKKILRWGAEHQNCCAMLYGVHGGEEGIVISGACRVKKVKRHMGSLVFSSKTWRSIKEQKQEKYPRLDAVGLCIVQKDGECRVPPDVRCIAQGHFGQAWQVVLAVDSGSWQCRFYQWDKGELRPVPGYYLVKKQAEEPQPLEEEQVCLTKPVPPASSSGEEKVNAAADAGRETSPAPSLMPKEQPSLPQALVDEVRAYGRRVRVLTALVTVMVIIMLGAGTVLGIRQSSLTQPVWAQQAELESRVAQLEDELPEDSSLDEELNALKQQLADLSGKSREQEQRISRLSDRVSELEQKLQDASSSLPKHHIVQPGETLTAISIRYFGTPDKALYLVAINGIKDPDKVQAGAVLRLSE